MSAAGGAAEVATIARQPNQRLRARIKDMKGLPLTKANGSALRGRTGGFDQRERGGLGGGGSAMLQGSGGWSDACAISITSGAGGALAVAGKAATPPDRLGR